jgi:hypothetical protein
MSLVVAICADLVQIVFPMFFGEGFLSPLNDVLDVVVCVVLTLLIGWHIAFLPSFLLEVVPIANLAPTWTIAVLIALRARKESATIDVEAEPVSWQSVAPKRLSGRIDIAQKEKTPPDGSR